MSSYKELRLDASCVGSRSYHEISFMKGLRAKKKAKKGRNPMAMRKEKRVVSKNNVLK